MIIKIKIKTACYFQASPKAVRWNVRFTETFITLLCCNAKTAYVIANDKKRYDMLDFYKDILGASYEKMEIIKTITIRNMKPNLESRKVCNWTQPVNCMKRTAVPCMNDKCKKIACADHSISLDLN